MKMVTAVLEILRRMCEEAGPYLLLELLLPGGTLVALLLFLYRRRRLSSASAVRDGKGVRATCRMTLSPASR